jgi:hypothetical protein
LIYLLSLIYVPCAENTGLQLLKDEAINPLMSLLANKNPEAETAIKNLSRHGVFDISLSVCWLH